MEVSKTRHHVIKYIFVRPISPVTTVDTVMATDESPAHKQGSHKKTPYVRERKRLSSYKRSYWRRNSKIFMIFHFKCTCLYVSLLDVALSTQIHRNFNDKDWRRIFFNMKIILNKSKDQTKI